MYQIKTGVAKLSKLGKVNVNGHLHGMIKYNSEYNECIGESCRTDHYTKGC